MCDSIVCAPVIHKIVPSVRDPASRSIAGPIAASMHDTGVASATSKCTFPRYCSPSYPRTASPRSSGSSTSKYSAMCRAGLSNDIPNIPSITTWCDKPIPSTNRDPPEAACTVTACCAIACGCRGYVGTTAVISSIRSVSCAASVSAPIASCEKMFAIAKNANPSPSALRASSTMSPTLAAGPVAPVKSPIFIAPLLIHAGPRHQRPASPDPPRC